MYENKGRYTWGRRWCIRANDIKDGCHILLGHSSCQDIVGHLLKINIDMLQLIIGLPDPVSSQRWTVAGVKGWERKMKMKRRKSRRMRERWEGEGARWEKWGR